MDSLKRSSANLLKNKQRETQTGRERKGDGVDDELFMLVRDPSAYEVRKHRFVWFNFAPTQNKSFESECRPALQNTPKYYYKGFWHISHCQSWGLNLLNREHPSLFIHSGKL